MFDRRLLLLVAALFAINVDAQAPAAAKASRTLWLVQPLYPGQEMLVGRTETAISDIIPKDQRPAEIIGRKELEAALAGQKPSLGCITGETACADPVDALFASLGFDRIVLIRGGQDEGGYRYKVTSYQPAKAEVSSAEGTNAKLEKALLGALVKVVPLASTMEISSTPSGATIYIDGEKVGQTPLETQVLPGERGIKLELGSHLPVELTEHVPVRGTVRVQRALEKVPARLTVIARPEGALISVDGKASGKDKVDQGIQPGKHLVKLSLEGYLPYEEALEIAPGDTATVDRTLAPTTMTGVKSVMRAAQEDLYARRSYFLLGFESAIFNSAELETHLGTNPREVIGFPAGREARLNGINVEYGSNGRYFGIAVIGASYVQGGKRDIVTTQDRINSEQALIQSLTLRALQPQLRIAVWRFSFGLQAGVDARLTQFLYRLSTDAFGPANRAIDLEISGQANLRVYLFEGLFLNGSFRASKPILRANAGFNAFHGGFGYAF